MAVKSMAFVAYPVRDVPKAVAYYRDVIGLKEAESFGDRWVGSTSAAQLSR